MIRHIFIFTVIAIVFSGCFRGPLPDGYEKWVNHGHTKHEVGKALLECGYDNSLGGLNADENTGTLAYKCMEKAGFIASKEDAFYKYRPCFDNTGNSSFKTCSLNPATHELTCWEYPLPPACFLPLDQVPDRNITKRLNSEWCKHKLYRTYQECQP